MAFFKEKKDRWIQYFFYKIIKNLHFLNNQKIKFQVENEINKILSNINTNLNNSIMNDLYWVEKEKNFEIFNNSNKNNDSNFNNIITII